MHPRRWQLTAVALVTLVVGGALGPRWGAGPSAEGLHGAALWSGGLPLTARIVGHAHALPVAAARCLNCHAGAVAASAPAAGLAPVDGPAPVLTARHLRESRPRRGGPPSRYDAASFCTLLRTGVDPAAVLLPRQMPRYEISDADCGALWVHLTRKPA